MGVRPITSLRRDGRFGKQANPDDDKLLFTSPQCDFWFLRLGALDVQWLHFLDFDIFGDRTFAMGVHFSSFFDVCRFFIISDFFLESDDNLLYEIGAPALSAVFVLG